MRQDFTLFKRGEYWYYYSYQDGKRFRRSTGAKTKAEAVSVILDRQKKNTLHQSKRLLFEVFAADFFSDNCQYVKQKIATGGHLTRTNIKNYRSIVINRLIPHFGKMHIDEITPPKIRAWLTDLPEKYGISNKTANNYLSVLRTILQEALFNDIIPANPCLAVRQLAMQKNRRNSFTAEQIKQIFSEEWKDSKVRLMAMLSATTGMRLGECVALTREQIHDTYIEVTRSWEYGVGPKCPKGRKTRTVPLSETVRQEILSIAPQAPDALIFHANGKDSVPFSHHYIDDTLQDVLFGCGIVGLTFHSFRHFFNTELVRAGVRPEIIRAVVGHESAEMTEHYLHLKPQDYSEIPDIFKKLF